MITADTAVDAVSRLPLARRAAAYGPSFWATLHELFGLHPDVIYFGGGVPAKELMPVDRLRLASARAWEDAPHALDYGEVAGYRPLRRLIAERMATQGMTVDPEQIVVTNGSQQGIDIAARLFLDPGDGVVVEAPSFLDGLRTFEAYEASFVPVLVDDGGLRIDALEAALATAPRPPKLIYTIPTFQNPTGTTLSRRRREGLLALARDRGIVVVEDDPYGELRYGDEPEPPLRALDPDVLYLGTFSKTIAPGLRVGWMAVPERLVSVVRMAKEGTDIHNERIMTRTVFHAADGFLDDHLATVRGTYRRRRDALLASLAAHMPAGVRWSKPGGGFFVWVELPEALRADDLLPVAARQGVIYLPGPAFYPLAAPGGHNALRLNFSTLAEERIEEGVRRLAAVIADAT